MRSFSFSRSSSNVALLSLAASMGLASVSYAAPAQIVSVQFPPSYYNNYNTLSSTDLAGVAPYHVANWNVLNTSYSRDTGDVTPAATYRANTDLLSQPLVNSTGAAATSIGSFSLTYDRNEGSGDANPFGSDGDHNLGSGDNFSQSPNFNVSTSLTGLNVADSYDLIAYVAGNYFSGNVTSVVNLSETSLAGINIGTESEAFTVSNSAASFMNGVNYVEFDNLSNVSELDFSIPNNTVAGFGGFQLIDNGAPVVGATGVPEPTALGLLTVGGMALLKRRRRA